ncbi:MAG: hypothetical protein DDT26_02736 [Dehalococcoidia bacterium]|nr:MAG: hypothetical protein BME93_04620 [Methanosarcinales archaeon Met12]MBT9161430.1 hypothetical protein [Chloroflexota bacterium]WRQ72882.1 MAG: hypothetical protein BME93_04650 [Methanosarcinales archaeon Met12]
MASKIGIEGKQYKLFSMAVPWQHFILAIGTFLCTITGLFLLFAGGAYGFIPGLAGKFAGYLNDPTMIILHYVGAAGIVGAAVYHMICVLKDQDSIFTPKADYIGEGPSIKNILAMVSAKYPLKRDEYDLALQTYAFVILFAMVIVTGFIKLFKVELLAIITPLGYAHNVIFMASVLHGIATVLLIPLIIIHIIDSVTAVT